MRRLRIEPYDPYAVDGDGDGIVQEGTAWERPAGTRLLDSSGREIRAGAVLTQRPTLRVVSNSGEAISYVPTYERTRSGRKPSTLGSLGYPTLGERGVRTVRSLGVPTLRDRGFRPIGEIFGRGTRQAEDPVERVLLRREELLQGASPEVLTEQNRITDFIASLVNRSDLDGQQKSSLFAALTAAAVWATLIFNNRRNLEDRELASRFGVADEESRRFLEWLDDIRQIGGDEALQLAVRSGVLRIGEDDELIRDFLSGLPKTTGEQESDSVLLESIRDFGRELEEFITPDGDGQIPSTRPAVVPDVGDTNEPDFGLGRVVNAPANVSEIETGLPFYLSIAELLRNSPAGRATMQEILNFFNRRYRQNLTLDEAFRILDDRRNGFRDEFEKRKVNHFFTLLIQHDAVRGFVKRQSAEDLADRILSELNQRALSETELEQIARFNFGPLGEQLVENSNLPSIFSLPSMREIVEIFDTTSLDGIDEIYPGQSLDDGVLRDLIGWSITGTKPSWISRPDLNPLFAMLFRDRPYIIKANVSWTSKLKLVPALLMPVLPSDTPEIQRDKETLSKLIKTIRSSPDFKRVTAVTSQLKTALQNIEKSAYKSLARRLRAWNPNIGPALPNFDKSKTPPWENLLQFLHASVWTRNEDYRLTGEGLSIITEFLGFDPFNDERYIDYFKNPDADSYRFLNDAFDEFGDDESEDPSDLFKYRVPELPSPLRSEFLSVENNPFLSRATISEYFEDVGLAIGNQNLFPDDKTLDEYLQAIIDKLESDYGDGILLNSALANYASASSLANQLVDDIRYYGFRENQFGREAIVTAMESLIHQWALSANDALPRSLAIQDIVQELFGLDGAFSFEDFYRGNNFDDINLSDIRPEEAASLERQRELIRDVKRREGDLIRLFVRAQYLSTQDLLRSMGLRRVTIVRGFTMAEDHPDYDRMGDIIERREASLPGRSDEDLSMDVVHLLRPLSSWTTDWTTAQSFSRNIENRNEPRHEVVVVSNIPAEQVFSTASNGTGCLTEYELVVLGAPTETRMYDGNAVAFLTDDDTVPQDNEGGLDREWFRLVVTSPLGRRLRVGNSGDFDFLEYGEMDEKSINNQNESHFSIKIAGPRSPYYRKSDSIKMNNSSQVSPERVLDNNDLNADWPKRSYDLGIQTLAELADFLGVELSSPELKLWLRRANKFPWVDSAPAEIRVAIRAMGA